MIMPMFPFRCCCVLFCVFVFSCVVVFLALRCSVLSRSGVYCVDVYVWYCSVVYSIVLS